MTAPPYVTFYILKPNFNESNDSKYMKGRKGLLVEMEPHRINK